LTKAELVLYYQLVRKFKESKEIEVSGTVKQEKEQKKLYGFFIVKEVKSNRWQKVK